MHRISRRCSNMEENRAHTPHPEHGHEASDINVWAVGKFAFALVGVTVVSLVLLFGLMKYFQSQERPEVMKPLDMSKNFPEPRLQTNPIPDLKTFRAEE